MVEFLMPTLGADMSAGTLTAWKVKAGDAVQRGEIVAVVETDKADVEVEVFTGGVVEKLLVEAGAKVPVGTPLAVIREEGAVAGVTPAPAAPPRATALGSLCHYISHAPPQNYQPANIAFDLLPPLCAATPARLDRKERHARQCRIALEKWEQWIRS